MKIAVEGCCHGELDAIYSSVKYVEQRRNIKIDLLLICGDFQAVRNTTDMTCMAVPPKYQTMNSFHKYYSGQARAPVLTVFVGGNHEASNFLQELPYGGWVAPNIYYLGYAGVIQIGGLRIAGLSGISKERDYCKGHFEHPPYDENSKRSVYHVRNLEVFRLSQISRPVDICLSHDWPRGIYDCGDKEGLLRWKKFFREEVTNGTLGSAPARELLCHLKPHYWFAAHLHCKFAAHVKHPAENGGPAKTTKFLALDKCLPRKDFLQVLDMPHNTEQPLKLHLDPEWLVILKTTNHLLNLKPTPTYLPGQGSTDRWDFSVSEAEMEEIRADFGDNMAIPENFEVTAPVYDPSRLTRAVPRMVINPQTKLLCTMLDVTNPFAVFMEVDSTYSLDDEKLTNMSASQNPDEIDVDEDDDDDNDDDDVSSSSDASSSDSQDNNEEEGEEGGSPSKTPSPKKNLGGKFRTPKSLLRSVLKAQMRSAHLTPGAQSKPEASGDTSPSSLTPPSFKSPSMLKPRVMQGCLTKSLSTPPRIESNPGSQTSPAFSSSESSASPVVADDDEELASILALQKKALSKIEDRLSVVKKESKTSPAEAVQRGDENSSGGSGDNQKEKLSLGDSVSAVSSSSESLPAGSGSTADGEETLATTAVREDNSSASPSVTSPGGQPEVGMKRNDSEVSTPPGSSVKKFKRRNQQMYSQPDEDA